jgi:NAD(P)H dehydrogenase (quinone)
LDAPIVAAGPAAMKVLLVLAHHRRASLSGAVADIFAETLRANGNTVEFADLVAEGFDPVLREPDEPDWNDPDKAYSPEVRREMARIERNEATVMIFPVYWWSVPAILRGWIDRVWNHGWAYGGRTFPQRRAWMVGIAGNSAESFARRGYDTAMHTQLQVGILDYCGVPDNRLTVLYGSLEGEEAVARLLAAARDTAAEF